MTQEIRPFRTLEEYEACVRLQEEVWGGGFSERIPVAMLKVAQRLGGIAAGAWGAPGDLQGFVFGVTGPLSEEAIAGAEIVHWSDMLAVRPESRGRGLGRRLKLYQRARLLDRGVRTVLWTFDPLEARNAHLNLGRLGAVAREYLPNMYGRTGSPLHGSIETDRLLAVWVLDSPRVEERVGERAPADGAGGSEGRGPADLPTAFAVEGDDVPRPRGRVEIPDADAFLVPVPADIQALRARDPDAATAWREATRAAFTRALDGRAEVREMLRGDGAVSHYLLVRVANGAEPS